VIESRFTWATVTQVSPLRIRIGGDSTALLVTPQTLVDPRSLALNDHVHVEFAGGTVTVLGRVGGLTALPELLVGSGLGGGIDLDTITTTGQYHQGTNANATLALHYPLAAIAGLLVVEVGTTGSSTLIRQTYVTRPSASASRVFSRAKYGANAWSSWAELTDPWGGDSLPVFQARFASNFTKSGAASWVKIPFTTELVDVGGIYDAANSRFTAPVAGRYEFIAALLSNTSNGGPLYRFRLNTETLSTADWDGGGYQIQYSTATIARIYDLAAGDTVEVWVFNANGVTVTLDSNYGNRFSGKLLR
jgi:hypothetical protein